MYKFEWDENKNRINKTKHGIAFENIWTVFLDENAIVWHDLYHSTMFENRYIIIGETNGGMCVTVVFVNKYTDVIRIINARKPTRKEKETYEKRKLN